MDLQKKFGTNSDVEQQGVDVHLGEDAYITIKRAGGANAAYRRESLRTFRKHKRALDNETLSEVESLELMYHVYASSVVLGWRGIELDGQPLEYSTDNAVKLFRAVPEVYRIIFEEANKLANFRQEEISDQGNGSAPS